VRKASEWISQPHNNHENKEMKPILVKASQLAKLAGMHPFQPQDEVVAAVLAEFKGGKRAAKELNASNELRGLGARSTFSSASAFTKSKAAAAEQRSPVLPMNGSQCQQRLNLNNSGDSASTSRGLLVSSVAGLNASGMRW
jgi:hypothetical protein